jgi:molecular chaperone HtpG
MQEIKKHNTLISKLHKKRIRSFCGFSNYLSLDSKIEGDNKDITFVRVDSDHIDNSREATISKYLKKNETNLKTVLKHCSKTKLPSSTEAMDSQAAPFIITPEFVCRMKEMSQSGGGGMFGMGNMPEMHVQPSSEYKFAISNYNSK